MSILSSVCAALLTVMLALIATVGRCADEKEPPVSGLFKGNGKEAKLMYVTAQKGRPSLDKPTIVLIFTEKDHSKEKDPKFAASFGRCGSALIITVDHEGDIIGCQVAHSAHEKSGFTDIGRMKLSDYKVADGKVKGKLSSGGEVETFGEKWEVKIQFQTKAP
jgi:hypothetical protein